MTFKLELTPSGNNRRKHGEWILYRDDIVSTDDPAAGEVVDLEGPDGGYRGRGFYSDRGRVAVHVVANSKIPIDESFFRDRLERAGRLRERWYSQRSSYRLVNSDGDYLPGLIVDRFGDYLVVQFRSQAMDRYAEDIVEVLDDLLSPRSIYQRADLSVRDNLGLDTSSGLLMGDKVPDRVEVQSEPYTLVANITSGQKTGFYLDQADNRRRLWDLDDPGKAVDCFSYSGSWGFSLLHAGSEHVTFVDQSEDALKLVSENAKRNGWEDRISTIQRDGFDFLDGALERDEQFDTVVLDPPAFAKSNQQTESARKGYKGINYRAMRLLKPEGFLATSSCSHPIDMELFTDIVRESAHDAHVSCQVLERRYQSRDHPWLLNLDTSRYLTCVLAKIMLV